MPIFHQTFTQHYLLFMPERIRQTVRLIGSAIFLFVTFALHAQTTDEATLKNKISKCSALTGLTAANLQDAFVAKTFTDKSSGIEYVYLQQTYKGIPVYNSIKTLAFKNDKLVYSSGSFIQKEEKVFSNATPSLEASTAVLKAAQHLHLPEGTSIISFLKNDSSHHYKKLLFTAGKLAKRDIEVQLYWAPDSVHKWHLAWNVNIDVANSPDWWNVRIDARNGAVINKDNWTTYEQSPHSREENLAAAEGENFAEQYLAPPPNDASDASYYVIPFPAENLTIKSFATQTNPWEMAGANNNATTYGWHYNGNTTYNITRGNNVYAYDDSANKNQPGSVATSVSTLPDLSFPFTPDLNQTTSLSVNKSAAITNLFYWNNLMHDVMYQYGFNEASGNFQQNNISRGGIGNDPVNAEAHDGSGLNNANFSSPDDGTSGRMQMYLWNAVKLPSFTINSPASIAGSDSAVESGFSQNNKLIQVGAITDTVVLYNTDSLACSAILPTNLKGQIALIYRGTCNFTVKVKNAQNAGAVAVIMVNTKGSALLAMSGSDSSITIPSVMVSYDVGNAIADAIKGGSDVTASLKGAPLLDGDFDNGIICHEYGHGVTHRLTGGNASCMSNAERPDEGWSDYFGIMMTQDWTNTQLSDSAKSRSFGTYVFGEPVTGNGIRTYPYNINMTVDPHTYSDIKNTSSEVHYIGEIWCSALWDMTWGIIKQEGGINKNIYDAAGGGGNNIALQLIIEGEKLQPCSPGFLDARDAILATDSILYNNRHKCVIWNAFSRRGMGFSAIQGSSDKTDDQTAAFDLPVLRLLTETLPSINDQLTTNITVSCECALPPNGYQLKDTIPAGFTASITSPQATMQGNAVTWNASNFTALGQSNTYSVTLLPNATTGCTKDTILYDDRDVHTSGGFASSVARGTNGWTVSTAQAYSPTHSWHAADPETPSDFSLTSGVFTVAGFPVLSFYHHFITEAGYDGGMVDISTNNGSSWTSAAPYFFSSGYNGVIYQYNLDTTYGTTPMPAFTGTLKDSGFQRSLIDLSSFAGKSIKVRFRMYSDLGTTYDGWYVDNISLTNACGGVQHIGLYNNANKKIDSAGVADFNIDSNGVVQPAFGNFTAIAVNNTSSLLNWTTVEETGAASFVVERSTDSLTFTTLTTVAAMGVGTLYTFTDNNPAGRNNFYRIRMVNSGVATLVTSPVRKVVFTHSTVITLAPNPSSSRTTVLIDAGFNAKSLAVFDMAGRRILTAIIGGGITSYPINVAVLNVGIYVVEIVSATGEERRVKMIVQR